MTSPRGFDHERLDVYRDALDLVVLADRMALSFTGVRKHLGWQLHRAACSVVLNIAEGSGRYRPGDKAQFFVIASGSVAECAAIVDIGERLGIGEDQVRSELRTRLNDLARRLISLSRTVRRRA